VRVFEAQGPKESDDVRDRDGQKVRVDADAGGLELDADARWRR